MIHHYKDKSPLIDSTAFIAPDTVITGDVEIGEYTSVWFKTVIRGDVAPVKIGSYSNIQDLSLLHQSPNKPLIIEDYVTVGHQVTLHSAIIRKHALIGMGSVILDGAEVGEGAFIGAGSLIPQGKKIPPKTLAFGRPAKVIRELTDKDIEEMQRIQKDYVQKGIYYKEVTAR
ncbi:Carbonic anhydrase or acetyltransferase, isoleucine patch superfamily [Gracilibacillus ureilyticus]|uniref:Carbonic anhydrase or acetyltransferase, isoleucine patch superfamily n=1 Tax=Gracilibacillus ureilyticus TaxID=531814 RepID=A0A1H9TQP5_9BACI|nr:gamma carbonic anhydrase family protein [Gracilibacillus ureilyticus]SER99358.1 Carbonic anhydrase or acetyltransferase, isoleucine patch superfamily [Gracilibacillus ureilyticus]